MAIVFASSNLASTNQTKSNKMTPLEAYRRALEVGKRSSLYEDIILGNPFFAYLYSKNIIKDRWIEAEDIIMKDLDSSSRYAQYVIKGKLPNKMHNTMLFCAMEDPSNGYLKRYFEFIHDSTGSI